MWVRIDLRFIACGLLTLLCCGRTETAQAQGKTGGPAAATISGGKTGGPLPEQGRAIVIPVVKRVVVPPNEGYLALFTVPQAKAVLRPVTGAGEAGPLPSRSADANGLIAFPRLSPGKYRLEITCTDYDKLTDMIAIERGKQTARLAPLRSLFATLRVGLGNQAKDDIIATLNGKPFKHKLIENGQLVFERVPVGKQTFTFSNPNLEAWTQEIEIRPGENFFSATMGEVTVALTIKTEPNADVYLDDEPQRVVSTGGELTFRVQPSARKVRVEKPGFEPAERELNLSPDIRAVTKDVRLIPITDDVEFNESFDAVKGWSPQPPGRLSTDMPKGRIISSETVALAFNSSRPNRSFNIYGDFQLGLDVQFANGKGAAWVVRAADYQNYYLFELERARKLLKLYVCRAGKLVEARDSPQPIVADLSDVNGTYSIALEAGGNKFTHTITTPKGEKVSVIFRHDELRYGGVGLRAINGLVMFEQDFYVKPLAARK